MSNILVKEKSDSYGLLAGKSMFEEPPEEQPVGSTERRREGAGSHVEKLAEGSRTQ